jgi:hypothetical protein
MGQIAGGGGTTTHLDPAQDQAAAAALAEDSLVDKDILYIEDDNKWYAYDRQATAATTGATFQPSDAAGATGWWIAVNPPTSGGGGEINTSSNVGTGAGLAKNKVGVDLPFKSIISGTALTGTENTNDLTIDLDDTTVTPASYTNANITVDQQGRITSASNGSGGSGSPSLRNVSATDTFATASETVNCTANTFTVNLPTAVGIQGTVYTLVNSGTGIITLDPNGTETINGSLTIDLTQYTSRTVQSDGTNWIII